MKTKQMLLVAGGLSTIVFSAALLAQDGDRRSAARLAQDDRRPLIVTDVFGAVRVLQDVPCGDPVNVMRRLTGGIIEINPAEGVQERGVRLFALTRLTAFFEGFSVERTCMGISGRAEFSEIGVRLAGSVSLRAVKRGGRYLFTIPRDEFLIYESIIQSGAPEAQYQRPSQDVTGEIDLDRGTVHVHVVLASRLHFRAGCESTPFGPCIDVEKDGTQTADIFGMNAFPDGDGDRVPDRIDNCPLVSNADQGPVATPVLIPAADLTLSSCFDRRIGRARANDVCEGRRVKITSDAPRRFSSGPNRVTWSANDRVDPIVTAVQTVTVEDTTLPAVACTTLRPAGRFRVSADDDCDTPTLRLGEFTLADREVIHIRESEVPGVRLIGTIGPHHIRLFDVGRGQAIIRATDAGANVGSAVCR